VTQVQRLSEALPLFAVERFDAVLLDLFLSGSHGLDTFATLHTQAPNMPIVVLTGLDNETVAVEAVQGGAQDYLVKGQAEGQVLVWALLYAIERQRAEEALRYQRDWLDVTLSSIGDVMIATDTRGLVTFINPKAVELTGWTSAEALGRYIDEVFCIVHEQTRQAIDSPVGRVLREGTVVMLEDDAMLLARDGHEFCIADSAAPIRNS